MPSSKSNVEVHKQKCVLQSKRRRSEVESSLALKWKNADELL